MKIAMVSEHASPLAVLGGADAGGQNVHVAALALALAARGHEVDVYTRRDDPGIAERVRLGPGVEVVHVPAGPPEQLPKDDLLPHMPEFGQWLGTRWSVDRPDVVHAHFWMSGVACEQARKVAGFAFAQTFHALGVVKRRHQRDQDTSPAERLAIESRLACTADAVIATATTEVAELLAMGARPGSLHVVPCGVDQFPGTATDDRWWHGQGGRILSLGRLVERKGVDTVIAAVAQVPGAQLVVAGGPVDAFDDDPEVRRLRAEAERLDITDRVRLIGAVTRDEVPGLLRSADVVACTPWYEPFGIVPLEAMACGRPVVASAVGGLLDTVVDGVTGVHVPAKDPDRLAAVLRRLLADPVERRRLGEAGAARVAEKYTWPKVAAATEEVYRRITAPVAAGRVR
ncbi:glycosyltransferase family 1 protein [Kribbella sancticallisti]|uniref:Glycosyltransferase family 1 protein n=1 Tax=Kribbella sancticallisti TaxID=460087 RepID=A0ABN2DVG3_9ACTN